MEYVALTTDATIYEGVYTDKRVEELVKNGTMSAKMKALFEMRIFNEYQISHKGLLEENGRSFDQKQLKQKMDAIMDSINKSSPMEQLNAIDEIVSMQTVLVHQLMDNYASYIHEAPAGTDAYAYAVLKLKGSPLVRQQEALVSMMRSMGNTAGTDAASQAQEFARKRIDGAYPDQALLERVLKNGTLEDRVNMLYNLSVDSKLKYQYDDFKKKLLKSVLSEEGAGKHELAKILFRLDAGIKKHMLLPREEDDMFHIDGSYQKMSI